MNQVARRYRGCRGSWLLAALVALVAAGCDEAGTPTGTPFVEPPAGSPDNGTVFGQGGAGGTGGVAGGGAGGSGGSEDAGESPDSADHGEPDASEPDASEPDASEPDAAPDTSEPDAGGPELPPSGCTGCTQVKPKCENDQCVCTAFSCPAGSYCDGVDCQPCDVDTHCTPSCVDCTSFGQVCADDGANCVACGPDLPCGAGTQCTGGSCQPCNTAAACGEECLPCGGDSPDCVGGACACVEGSCGPGEWCKNGTCEVCNTATHCGFECVDCTQTGTPVCDNGQCKCTSDGQCGPGAWCDAGFCVACGTNDPNHCGPTCAVCVGSTPVCSNGTCACAVDDDCGESYWCSGGSCLLCADAAHCGPECLACSGTTPVCGGSTCVCEAGSCPAGQYCDGKSCTACTDSDPAHCGAGCASCIGTDTPVCKEGVCVCTSDAHCGEGQWCDGGACVPCGDDDPLHCGPTCALCAGALSACVGGQCLCDEGSCTPGYWCGPSGSCEVCNDADHCGPECLPCGPPTPVCNGSACVACLQDADCGAGYWCDAGACTVCALDDPDHCGASCAQCTGQAPSCSGGQCVCSGDSCGQYFQCDPASLSCLPCNTAEACGPSCAPCGAGTPYCAADSSGCGQCLDDTHCPEDEHCDAMTCVPDCQAQGCANDLAPNGEKCGSAKIVGRMNAMQGFATSGDTTGDGDDDNLSTNDSDCWDAKYDNFYRIYLIAGDAITVTASPQEFDFDLMMKLYQGTQCDSNASSLVSCYDDGWDGDVEQFTYTAASDGWYTIVIDGRMAFSSDYDYGDYNLVIQLTCGVEGCCCQ